MFIKKGISMRTKKYNPHKVINRISFNKVKKVLIAWSGNFKEPLCFTQKGEYIDMPASEINAMLIDLALNWSSLCFAICRDQNKNNYFKSVIVKVNTPSKYQEITDIFNEEHAKLLKGTNTLHKVNVAWIASPSGYDTPDDVIDSILTQMQVWNHPSKWERDNAGTEAVKS
jgi:hypothetical protein